MNMLLSKDENGIVFKIDKLKNSSKKDCHFIYNSLKYLIDYNNSNLNFLSLSKERDSKKFLFWFVGRNHDKKTQRIRDN
ncbi:hypothetical protein GCM10025854_07750 [Tetragenococcus muriaticus]|nr:hypothetical protein GCM10025854_07750 [Tetragenococcus muriaticus]